jgi:1,4-dihydroxy-2-naphthoate octaprenyltransferase
MEQSKITSKSKGIGAILVFLIIGLSANTLINYTQTSIIQSNSADRAVIGDEILVNSRKELEKIDSLSNQIK